MTDPVDRSDELDRRILAIPENAVIPRRAFFALCATIIVLLILVMVLVLGAAAHQVQERDRTINQLQNGIAQRDQQIARTEADLVELQELVRSLGGTVPTTTVPPESDSSAHGSSLLAAGAQPIKESM